MLLYTMFRLVGGGGGEEEHETQSIGYSTESLRSYVVIHDVQTGWGGGGGERKNMRLRASAISQSSLGPMLLYTMFRLVGGGEEEEHETQSIGYITEFLRSYVVIHDLQTGGGEEEEHETQGIGYSTESLRSYVVIHDVQTGGGGGGEEEEHETQSIG